MNNSLIERLEEVVEELSSGSVVEELDIKYLLEDVLVEMRGEFPDEHLPN